jgi:hypothetical protein
VFASLAVSSGLAVGQSNEFPPAPQPEPTWLESLWKLPIFKWLSGFEQAQVAPPEVAVAIPALPPCPVLPLQPVADTEAVLMEDGGSTLNLEGLTPRTNQALSRFERLVEARGGSFILTSAFRPATYQAHLRDVGHKWVDELKDNQNPSCFDLKAQVSAEFARHALLVSQHPVEVSDHTMGIGFDAAIAFPAMRKRRRISVDRIARLAGVSRPAIQRDPVHFRLIGGRT